MLHFATLWRISIFSLLSNAVYYRVIQMLRFATLWSYFIICSRPTARAAPPLSGVACVAGWERSDRSAYSVSKIPGHSPARRGLGLLQSNCMMANLEGAAPLQLTPRSPSADIKKAAAGESLAQRRVFNLYGELLVVQHSPACFQSGFML